MTNESDKPQPCDFYCNHGFVKGLYGTSECAMCETTGLNIENPTPVLKYQADAIRRLTKLLSAAETENKLIEKLVGAERIKELKHQHNFIGDKKWKLD